MKFIWSKKKERELTPYEVCKLADFAKTTIDNRMKMGMGFPMELPTTLHAYAIGERIPYTPDLYGKTLELLRIIDNLKK